MDSSQMSMQQVMLYAVLMNAAVGFVAGLVPLILGFAKGKRRYGILGFVVCIVGGAILGVIVSIPALIIFTWLIIRKTADVDTPQASDGSTL